MKTNYTFDKELQNIVIYLAKHYGITNAGAIRKAISLLLYATRANNRGADIALREHLAGEDIIRIIDLSKEAKV